MRFVALLAFASAALVMVPGCSKKNDAAAAGPVNTAHPSGCTLVGAWTGNYPPGNLPFSGRPLTLTFNADGSAVRESDVNKSDFFWTMEGPNVSFHGKKAEGGGRAVCNPEDVAKASPEFTADCTSFTVKMVSDPCKARAQALNGIAFKKK